MSQKLKSVLFVSLILWSVLSIALYIFLIDIEVLATPFYLVAGGAFIIVYAILNRGFQSVSFEESVAKGEKKRAVLARVMLLAAAPLLVAVCIDILLLNFNIEISDYFNFKS